MTTPIVAFIVFGACFGWVTFPHRHLFSEGPTADRRGAPGTLRERCVWVMVCSALWPIMALTGLHSAWLLSRRRAAAARPPRRD